MDMDGDDELEKDSDEGESGLCMGACISRVVRTVLCCVALCAKLTVMHHRRFAAIAIV